MMATRLRTSADQMHGTRPNLFAAIRLNPQALFILDQVLQFVLGAALPNNK